MNKAVPLSIVSTRSRVAVVAVVVLGTGLGLAGTDLVLPSVPSLPADLGGSPLLAQLTISAYAGGTAVGLLLWGAVAGRLGAGSVLIGSISAFAVLSLVAAWSPSIEVLIGVRGLQAVAGSAAAVVAPGVIRRLLGASDAARGLALLGSAESIVPAVAPVIGAAILAQLNWRWPYLVLGAAALAVTIALILSRLRSMTSAPDEISPESGSFRALISNPRFLRQGAGQALVQAGLLTFVVGAPAVIVTSMGGTISAYLVMQILNVAVFIVVANTSPRLADRWGVTRIVVGGTLFATFGVAAALVVSLSTALGPYWLSVCLLPVSIGLGLRGPVGFGLALEAGRDFERAAAAILLTVMAIAAGGGALSAALLDHGLTGLTGVTLLILTGAAITTCWSAARGEL